MSAPLDYAPTRRRRIRRRWIALTALLIAIIVAAYYHSELTAHAQLRWTVRQCLRYTRPADAVALEANPVEASALVTRDPRYHLFPSGSRGSIPVPNSAFQPADPWESFPLAIRAARSTPFASFVPPGPAAPAGLRFVRSMRGGGGVVIPGTAPVAAPLFVHARTAKGRAPRLVVVELDDDGLQGYVVDPGPIWGRPTLLWQNQVRSLGEGISNVLARGTTFQRIFSPAPGETYEAALKRAETRFLAMRAPASVYFGQADPNDSAKFTIRMRVANADFSFEGQLMPDDTIQIEGPLLLDVIVKIRDAAEAHAK